MGENLTKERGAIMHTAIIKKTEVEHWRIVSNHFELDASQALEVALIAASGRRDWPYSGASAQLVSKTAGQLEIMVLPSRLEDD